MRDGFTKLVRAYKDFKALSEKWKYNSKLVCPFCNTTGRVRTMQVKKKTGISGGKATGAILTGGVSLLATGLSRKQLTNTFECGNCGIKW